MTQDINLAHRDAPYLLVGEGDLTLTGHYVLQEGDNISFDADATGHRLKVNVTNGILASGQDALATGAATITCEGCTEDSLIFLTNISSTDGLQVVAGDGEFDVTGTGSDEFNWVVLA